MDKARELQKIRKDMENDRNLPLINKPEDVIPGDGNPEASIVLIGEAGGYHESVQRKPFVGNAGMLLNQLLQSIKLERKDVYVTNMVKTRPPNNRDPLPEELGAFGRYLDKEIEVIHPKVILTLGRFSMAKFVPGAKITVVHGKTFDVDWKGTKIAVVPMFHPAAALRSSEVMRLIKEDFQRLPELLKGLDKTETEQMQLV